MGDFSHTTTSPAQIGEDVCFRQKQRYEVPNLLVCRLHQEVLAAQGSCNAQSCACASATYQVW